MGSVIIGNPDYFWKTSQGKNAPQMKTYNQHLNSAFQRSDFPSEWAPYITELIGRESSWTSTAKNPNSTAHGYGQFLNSTRQNYEKKMGISYSDPVNQIIMTMQYVKDRYGTPQKALAHWDKNKWY